MTFLRGLLVSYNLATDAQVVIDDEGGPGWWEKMMSWRRKFT